MTNLSPWIAQMKFLRVSQSLSVDTKTEVTIIGGGIAGISTAYFILKHTNKSVMLLEGDKIAHGATGHNAGQVTSYFERHFVELVEEFGLKKAAEGQADIESAWLLLQEIIAEAQLSLPFYQFTGYAGFSTLDQLMFRLEEEALREKSGLPNHEFLVVNDPLVLLRIPDEFCRYYKVARQSDILDLLETNDQSYIAVKASRKGCLNSALFCEQLIEWMEKKYKDRFQIFEHSPVKQVTLGITHSRAETAQGTVTSEFVVLCTNGFENIEIKNEIGVDINGRFHEKIEGTIGYMTGYLSKENRPPTAISYFEPEHASRLDPYVYMTRRPREDLKGKEKITAQNLTCLGGPEIMLADKATYDRHHHTYPPEALDLTTRFLKKTFGESNQEIDYDFTWHGLMGYTKNGVRLIGFEPCNKNLLYNLGCNGIGILPSIYGGRRISQLVAGETLPVSMFDVLDQRCMIPE